ncbi:hypothetical protein SAMN04488082_10650 [Desulfomicrobium apsheronum]|uniref:Uncharacterized protein n=1 Tax=Desulfomicrobium apsheronum TaxID=52560 RepID=A0A1I3TQB1_9BACT|nr:hypothetical protein [Desulfomicrobium apsheronum]SFJ72772.1 hypothetical protein SAMN04488082_10650 [Desulfomicrobium apsheronum]
MRALLVLLSAVFIFGGCSKEVKLVSANSAQEPIRVEEQATVELRLSEMDLIKYVDADTGIWTEARNAGLVKVFNKILNKDIVIVPVAGMTPLGRMDGAFTQSGLLNTQGDPETGDLVQSFLISASFVGDLSLGGQIISLEEDRYIAGMHDVLYAMLYQTTPESLPSYVAIAEPVGELGTSFYRVIGMAEIKQLMQDTVALPKEQGGATGVLCNLEIIVSDREVEAGDRIFLMNVDVAALDPDAVIAQDEPDTVVVLPPHSDTVSEPSEQK